MKSQRNNPQKCKRQRVQKSNPRTHTQTSSIIPWSQEYEDMVYRGVGVGDSPRNIPPQHDEQHSINLNSACRFALSILWYWWYALICVDAFQGGHSGLYLLCRRSLLRVVRGSSSRRFLRRPRRKLLLARFWRFGDKSEGREMWRWLGGIRWWRWGDWGMMKMRALRDMGEGTFACCVYYDVNSSEFFFCLCDGRLT